MDHKAYMFTFSIYYQIVFHQDYTVWTPTSNAVTAVYLRSHKAFPILAILVHIGWYFVAVLTCIFMMTNEWMLLQMLISHVDITFLSFILWLDCLFFVILICRNSLYICDMSPLLDLFVAHICFYFLLMQSFLY